MRFKVYFFLCAVLALPLVAQNTPKFNLYNLDDSKFPTLTASVFAVDATNQRYKNLSVTDFDLFENGIQRDATMTLNCDTLTTPAPIAVCLVMDQSGSMRNKSPDGSSYWQWAKDGVRAFVNQMEFVPPSCVAITSFGGEAFLRCDYQTTRPPLIAALESIPNDGDTNYDEAFLNPSTKGGPYGGIAVLKRAPQLLRRILIILTDGITPISPQTQKIITECNANNIQVYAINFKTAQSSGINKDLKEICEKTTGMAFFANTKSDVVSFYQRIAREVQRNIDCRLTWTSFTGCTEASRTRNLRAVFYKPSPAIPWTGQYLAPPSSLLLPQPSVSTLTFSDPGAGNKVRKTFSIKAPSNSSITIKNILISPPNSRFSITNPAPFTQRVLQPDERMDVEVEFSQDVLGKIYTATLIIDGDPCDQTVNLNVIIPIVKLESPVGGEVYSGCDSIPIRWSGVPEDEPVVISYSADNGTTWKAITGHATGLQYIWRHKAEGSQYKIRVQRGTCLWLNTAGNTGEDNVNSISFHPKQNTLFTGGSFEKTVQFGGTSLSADNQDGYVALYGTNGIVLNAYPITGSGNEEVTNVLVDSLLNYAVCGTTTSQSITQRDITLPLPRNDSRALFVSSMKTDGSMSWMVAIGDTTTTGTGECYPVSLHLRRDSVIVVQGYGHGVLQSIYPQAGISQITLTMPDVATYFPFTAELRYDGTVISLIPGHYYPQELHNATAVLQANQCYETQSFDTRIECMQNKQQPRGATDIALRAVLLNPQNDVSKSSFAIQMPRMEFTSTLLSLPATDVGKTVIPNPYPVGSILVNKGKRPVALNTLTVIGIDAADFSIANNPAPGIIPGSMGVSLSVGYEPKPVSRKQRQAYLVAEGECGQACYVPIRAEAIFPKLSMTSVDMGRKRLKTVNEDTLFVINSDVSPIKITSIVTEGAAFPAFSWKALIATDSVIAANSSLPVVVTFIPQQIPIDSITIRVEAIGMLQPVFGKAVGRGWLPSGTSKGYSFATVPVRTLSPESGNVVIYSTDTLAPLHIRGGFWLNNVSDAFSISTPIPDTLLKNGEFLSLPLSYSPQTATLHKAYYVFQHDAAPGPDTEPNAYDTVEVRGDATDVTLDKSLITFSPILRCDTASDSFTIKAFSNQSSVTVTDFEWIEATEVFDVSPKPPFTLNSGESKVIRVNYKPIAVESSSATLVVRHSAGANDTIRFSATSASATLQLSDNPETGGTIGDTIVIPIEGTLSSSTAFMLDTIAIEVLTTPEHARLSTSSIILNTTTWNWNIDSSDLSEKRFVFYGKALTPQPVGTIQFLRLPFTLYLSGNHTDYVRYRAIADNVQSCLFLKEAQTPVSITPVCFWEGRRVAVGPMFALQLRQTNNDIEVEFTTPFQLNARCEIYNSLGVRVMAPIDYLAQQGKNTVRVQVAELSTGSYFCRMFTDGISYVQPFVIER